MSEPTTTLPHPRRQVAAVVVGNALEFYDFLTFSFFATQIGRAFFPSDDPGAGLLAALATFGVGFAMRPVGAWVIGRMGDRIGRKPAMLLSFTLMGVGVIGLALTPSHAQIGLAAPVLVVAFRMLQGFALGGEVGPTTAFLLEIAPPEKRGLYGSAQWATQDLAVLIAGVVGLVLSNLLTAAQLDSWGWRLAFLLGASIIPFGLWLRRNLSETLVTAREAEPAASPTERRGYLKGALLGGLLLAGGATVGYTAHYINTYAQTTLGMPASESFWATVAYGVCAIIGGVLGGVLSDRIGRKPVMLVLWLLLAVSLVPMFALMETFRSVEALVGASAWLAFLIACVSPPVLLSLAESFPARVRSAGLALTYALALAVFGGGTQFVAAWLTRVTGEPLAPAWYATAFVLVALAAMTQLRETSPLRQAASARTTNGS